MCTLTNQSLWNKCREPMCDWSLPSLVHGTWQSAPETVMGWSRRATCSARRCALEAYTSGPEEELRKGDAREEAEAEAEARKESPPPSEALSEALSDMLITLLELWSLSLTRIDSRSPGLCCLRPPSPAGCIRAAAKEQPRIRGLLCTHTHRPRLAPARRQPLAHLVPQGDAWSGLSYVTSSTGGL
jgi:hypothetical protein